MNLYLVQHGRPVPKEIDPERPLSARGVEDVNRVGAVVARNREIGGITKVLHSGKARAKETAEILANVFSCSSPEKADYLAPLDDPSIWANRIAAMDGDLMLVGHLPFLNRLSSLLLCGDAKKSIINFKMGGIVALGREERWALKWILIPELLV